MLSTTGACQDSFFLGTERKVKGVGHKRRMIEVEDTMVYIPIFKTLQVLLNNDCVAEEVQHFALCVCVSVIQQGGSK